MSEPDRIPFENQDLNYSRVSCKVSLAPQGRPIFDEAIKFQRASDSVIISYESEHCKVIRRPVNSVDKEGVVPKEFTQLYLNSINGYFELRSIPTVSCLVILFSLHLP